MKTELLKAKILDLLIKGELTARWRKDHKDIESAEILLEKIRSEKEKKLNDELIAKEKKPNAKVELKEVSKNDEPFEIPPNWRWCHLGDIVETNIGLLYSPSDIIENGGLEVLRSNNIQNGKIVYDNLVHVSIKAPEKCLAHKGDLLICARNGSKALVGKTAMIEKEGMAFGAFMAIIRSSLNPYILYFLNSPVYRSKLDGVNTTTINQITQNNLRETLFPLPPLEEQNEIARIAEKLLTMVDDVDDSYSNLEDLSKKAKSKVLDLLIKGELTSKWRDEHKDVETADILLEKIRSEKEKKLNDELITKEKKPTAKVEIKEVFKNDEPFEIPDSWKWCYVGDLIDLLSGRDLEPSYYNSEHIGIPYITGASNFKNNNLIINRWTNTPATISKNGDLLITCKGTVGLLAFNNIGDIHIARQIMALKSNNHVLLSFLYLFFLNYTTKIQNQAGGVIPGFDRNFLLKTLIPLPPLEEQKEMAMIAEKLLHQIDYLTNIDSVQNGVEEDE